MKKLDEARIDSTQLIDGALLKAYRDTVRLSDGSTSIREWIDHPGAAAVVPLFDDGQTILLRQFRYPPRRVFWEVPAGKIDQKGEPPLTVAHRELEEETGWRCEQMTLLGALYPCIGYSNELIHFYLAEGLHPGEPVDVAGEILDPVRMPFKKALAMAYGGEILDMKTVIALTYADRVRRSRTG